MLPFLAVLIEIGLGDDVESIDIDMFRILFV